MSPVSSFLARVTNSVAAMASKSKSYENSCARASMLRHERCLRLDKKEPALALFLVDASRKVGRLQSRNNGSEACTAFGTLVGSVSPFCMPAINFLPTSMHLHAVHLGMTRTMFSLKIEACVLRII